MSFERDKVDSAAMPETLPALSLVAVAGRRRVTLDVAREAERRGFSGLYGPSIFGNMAQSTALALPPERIMFCPAIPPISPPPAQDFAPPPPPPPQIPAPPSP